MAELLYADAPFAVRDDLAAAHRRALERIARPGRWWTGAERVAIAAEARAARDCKLCTERKAALSPGAVAGAHDAASELSDAAVDAIHRIATDPARLSRASYEKALAGGISDAQYVELVGVVVQVASLDAFCRGIGAPPRPLPAPVAGDPSRKRPAGARHDGAFVPLLAPGDVEEGERGVFDGPRAPYIERALSLVPDAVRAMKDLGAAQYVPMGRVPDVAYGGDRALSRPQIEVLAARVSALNECFY
jgi:hypothetical protein